MLDNYIPKITPHNGRILIVNERHGTSYYAARNAEEVYAVVLEIIKPWKYYYQFRNEPEEPVLEDVASKYEFEPGSSFYNLQKKATEINKKRIERYEDELKLYKAFHKAVDEENGKLAFWVFVNASHNDDYEFEYLENVKE